MKQVIFTVGRFNPPTRGHAKLVSRVKELARAANCDYRLFTTRSQDRKKNPLDVDQKLEFLKAFFPNEDFEATTNAFTACRDMAKEGYERALIVVGEDRDGEMIDALKAYINHPDAEKSIGMQEINAYVLERDAADFSATKARICAVNEDFEGFCEIVPPADIKVLKALFDAVRQGLR